jgi:hypothetical protein
MKQEIYNSIEANTPNHVIAKITKEKRFKSPNVNRMISVFIPYWRITYYCKTQKRADRIADKYCDREVIINKPKR